MANNQQFYRGGHKQHEGSRVAVHNTGLSDVLNDVKRVHKMAQVKFLWLLLDCLGVPITVLGIIANIDNFKAIVLFILAAAYVSARLYFFIAKNKQAVREKEYDLWDREMDKIERKNKHNNPNGK